MFSPVKGLLVLTSALLAAPSQIPAQECSRLEGASPDELTSYLDKTPRSPQNEACGALAISQLGGMRYKAAIPALTKWLELRWPPNAHQKQRRFVIEREGATIYPAAAALEGMGKDALPRLLNAMKTNRGVSRQWMEVAAEVWMTAYKDHAPAGVALLKREADTTKDPAIRNRVGWAAFFATRWCGATERGQCRAALETQYRN